MLEAHVGYDPWTDWIETPVNKVPLAPFFLSRYEMTQGQWARLTGGDHPSWYRIGLLYGGIPGAISDAHPVEQVSWLACEELMGHYGLVLPTEAQWEYGCRAGTATPWFTGRSRASLEGFANVRDRTAATVDPKWLGGEIFDDKFKGPSPVGTYKPNRFGLHDMHGNVWEWCRDLHLPYTQPVSKGNGLRETGDSTVSEARMERGGGFADPARGARSASRNMEPPRTAATSLGLRPAREITR